MKILSKVFYWLVLVVLILITGLVAISALNIPGSYKLLTVQSGSMSSAIQMGSVVVVREDREYKKDEIITFINPDTPESSVTHRVFEVKEDDGRIFFVTKGDANEEPDANEVESGWVLGKVIWTIPFLGYPVSFAKTLPGLILLVILPAVLIVGGELMGIKKEVMKMINNERK